MISSTAIAQFGLDAKSLRKRFDPENKEPLGKCETRLLARWRARAQMGRDFNLEHWRLFGAIDAAWDSGFRQTTQTLTGLVRDLSELGGEADAMKVAEKWGMTHLITKVIDEKTKTDTGKRLLNLPVMYGIHLSLARSTLLMRISRILNERLSVPLMKFEPAFMSDQNKLRCEITTQRIETGNREFGYSQTFCEGVQGAAMYGQQLQLIAEEWYHEMDYLDEGPRVGKEGLRYVLPHPSRSYWDIDWPTWTFNNDSGTRFVGYWRVTTFGNVRNQKGWWNLERIARSDRFADPKWQAYFQTTGQCRMSVSGNNDWFSKIDRERRIDTGTAWFTASEDDQPIWVTEHFEKFNPREEFEDPNMPDCEIWFRIVMASDDTPLYVTALCERPGIMWLYEPIGSRAIQQGLMLELIPFEDHCSNLLTQGIISAKQNLANITLYDKDFVDPEDVKRDLENPGEKLYRKLNFWGFNGKKLIRQQTSVDAIFKSYRFPTLDVSTHLSLVSQLVSLMQRVVGMSDQEVGSSATHEQSAEEIRTIHTATSHRFEYVAAWIDFTFESWKRQLAAFYFQYSSGEAYAYLTAENAERVKKAGFEARVDYTGGMVVRAPMKMLRLENYVAQRDGPNRIPWTTIGGQMLSFLQMFVASPLAGTIPPEQSIRLINEALDALQFPKSFRIPLPGTADSQIPQVTQAYIQNMLKELATQVKTFVEQKSEESNQITQEELKKLSEQTQEQIQKVGQLAQQEIQKAEMDARAYVDGKTAEPRQMVIHQNQAPGTNSESPFA